MAGAVDSSGKALEQLRAMPRVPLSEWIFLFREAGDEWINDQAQRLGASLAFYSLLSLAPLLVITVAVAGLVFGREAANGQLAWQIQNLVGLDEARGLQAIVHSAQRPAVGLFATLLSLVLLCYKRRTQQKGQQGSCWMRTLAILMRRVAMDCGLCRSARTRRAAGLEVGRNLRGA